MSTCETCKWWGSPYLKEVFRPCKNPKTDDDLEQNENGAKVNDEERRGMAWLSTGPKFCCIHWESR